MSPDTQTKSTPAVRIAGIIVAVPLALTAALSGAPQAAAASSYTIGVKSYADGPIKVYPKTGCRGTGKTVQPGGSAKGLSYDPSWKGREYWSGGSRAISSSCQPKTNRNISIDVFPAEM